MLLLLLLARAAETFDVAPVPPSFGTAAWQAHGHGLAPAGDLDGDGYDDLVVGGLASVGTPGLVLLYGDPGGLRATTVGRLDGEDGCCHGVSVGDFDGDGAPDVVTGVRRLVRGSYENTVVVLPGDGAAVAVAPTVSLADPFTPAEQSTWGQVIAALGDVDGDGWDDLGVAVTRYDDRRPGQVRVFRGGAGGLDDAPAWTLEAPDAHGDFGVSLAAAGDVNGDGHADLVVGNSRRTDAAAEGAAYLYLGSPQGPVLHATLAVAGSSEELGEAVAGGGDVDGDGYDDVLVADPRDCAREEELSHVHVFWGDPVQVDPAVFQTLSCPDADCSYYADTLDFAGDIDGDGHHDLVVGNAQYGGDHALLYRGTAAGFDPAPLRWLRADFASGAYGEGVARAGDVDGDGHADVVIADTYWDRDWKGAAQVWLGGPVVEGSRDTAGPPDTGDTGAPDDPGDTAPGDPPEDSGAPDDPPADDPPADDPPADEPHAPEAGKGCGCAAGGGGGAGALALGAALLLVRRRRRHR